MYWLRYFPQYVRMACSEWSTLCIVIAWEIMFEKHVSIMWWWRHALERVRVTYLLKYILQRVGMIWIYTDTFHSVLILLQARDYINLGMLYRVFVKYALIEERDEVLYYGMHWLNSALTRDCMIGLMHMAWRFAKAWAARKFCSVIVW